MKIGILSDTHRKKEYAQQVINHLLSEGAEFLIHAGDIVEEEVLEQLQNSKVRYIAVYGNNDAHLAEVHNQYHLVQEPHYFKLAGTKFKLMHLPFYMSADTEIVLFGHTHTFECDFKKETLYLNPGEACARSKPVSECAMLEVSDEYLHVTHYTRPLKKTKFKAHHFSFERES
ncbi:MAG: YfcE family phosphodiesterase [Epsilonproteobacteria bacterium]|nr:MAG: YfcE family phosphodiesterase [Campylobacterota bacterium]